MHGQQNIKIWHRLAMHGLMNIKFWSYRKTNNFIQPYFQIVFYSTLKRWTIYNLLCRLIKLTQQSNSRNANSSSACQEIPHILLSPKFHHRIHKSPKLVLSWDRWVQSTATKPICTGSNFNIILPYMPGFFQWSLSLTFAHHKPVHNFPSPHFPSISFFLLDF